MPVTINGTTGITTPALVNGTALAFRNKIINGNFAINQRVYVSGTATSGANEYTLDRWRVVTSGQNLTFSASGIGNIVTAPAGGIEQVIESLNIEGGTYTLSWTGTATGAVNGSAVSNGSQVTLPSNTNATIKFSSGTVSLVQLEEGSVATPFENRPIGTELALCQRYYATINDVYFRSYQLIGGTAGQTLFLPVQMRSSPTLTKIGTWQVANCTQPIVGVNYTSSGKQSFYIASQWTASGDGYFTTSNSGEFVTAQAEL